MANTLTPTCRYARLQPNTVARSGADRVQWYAEMACWSGACVMECHKRNFWKFLAENSALERNLRASLQIIEVSIIKHRKLEVSRNSFIPLSI